MEVVKELLFKENPQTICFMCFEVDERCINIDDSLEIHDETSVSSISLRNISKYLFCYFEITTLQACEHCATLMMETYTIINRGLLKIKLMQQIVEKIDKKINSKPVAVENKLTLGLHDEKPAEYVEKHGNVIIENTAIVGECKKLSEKCDADIQSQTINKYVDKHKKKRINTNKCSQCDYKTISKLDLESHINRSHLNLRPFICNLCQKGFFSSKNLKEHTSTHEKCKIMMCDVCGERFSYRKTLIIHMRSHIHFRPYSCESCSHTFVTLSQKNEHVKRKHGTKMFSCNLCDKKYSLQKDLRRHMKNKHITQK